LILRLGVVVGVDQAADAELAFSVEVGFAPLGVGRAGLVGILGLIVVAAADGWIRQNS
jgi:hypothetical protein